MCLRAYSGGGRGWLGVKDALLKHWRKTLYSHHARGDSVPFWRFNVKFNTWGMSKSISYLIQCSLWVNVCIAYLQIFSILFLLIYIIASSVPPYTYQRICQRFGPLWSLQWTCLRSKMAWLHMQMFVFTSHQHSCCCCLWCSYVKIKARLANFSFKCAFSVFKVVAQILLYQDESVAGMFIVFYSILNLTLKCFVLDCDLYSNTFWGFILNKASSFFCCIGCWWACFRLCK